MRVQAGWAACGVRSGGGGVWGGEGGGDVGEQERGDGSGGGEGGYKHMNRKQPWMIAWMKNNGSNCNDSNVDCDMDTC